MAKIPVFATRPGLQFTIFVHANTGVWIKSQTIHSSTFPPFQVNSWWTICDPAWVAYWAWWIMTTITIICTITIRPQCTLTNNASQRGPATHPTNLARCTVCRSIQPATRLIITRRPPDEGRWLNRLVRIVQLTFIYFRN